MQNNLVSLSGTISMEITRIKFAIKHSTNNKYNGSVCIEIDSIANISPLTASIYRIGERFTILFGILQSFRVTNFCSETFAPVDYFMGRP